MDVSGACPKLEREEKRFPVSGRPDLSLSTFDGSVEIRAWDRPEILVVIEKRAETKRKPPRSKSAPNRTATAWSSM
jgi:hypothetical protein